MCSKGNREGKQIGCKSQISQIKQSRNHAKTGCSFSSPLLRSISKRLLCVQWSQMFTVHLLLAYAAPYVYGTQSVQTRLRYSHEHPLTRVGEGHQETRRMTCPPSCSYHSGKRGKHKYKL